MPEFPFELTADHLSYDAYRNENGCIDEGHIKGYSQGYDGWNGQMEGHNFRDNLLVWARQNPRGMFMARDRTVVIRRASIAKGYLLVTGWADGTSARCSAAFDWKMQQESDSR